MRKKIETTQDLKLETAFSFAWKTWCGSAEFLRTIIAMNEAGMKNPNAENLLSISFAAGWVARERAMNVDGEEKKTPDELTPRAKMI